MRENDEKPFFLLMTAHFATFTRNKRRQMKINEWIQRAREDSSRRLVEIPSKLFERLAFTERKRCWPFTWRSRWGSGLSCRSLAGLFSGSYSPLPIVAGTFVDRYGFKKTLVTCFSSLCVGYFLIGFAGWHSDKRSLVQSARPVCGNGALLTALGGSLIKPCIVGT